MLVEAGILTSGENVEPGSGAYLFDFTKHCGVRRRFVRIIYLAT